MLVQHNLKISLSFLCLTLLIFFTAYGFGLIPDKRELIIQKRIDISENLAIQLSTAIQHDQKKMISNVIRDIVERNKEIQSISVEKSDGLVIAEYGKHPVKVHNTRSTENLMKAPIFKDNKVWGITEVHFIEIHGNQWWRFVDSTFFRLVSFISLFGFILYFLLVRKVLMHLDPHKVIPVRVKLALDAVSDGMVFIDDEERIVLANDAFEKKFNFKTNDLLGKKLSSFSWRFSDSSDEKEQTLPWQETLDNDSNRYHVALNYKLTENESLTVIVNSTPLRDKNNNVCGALVSFNDVTDLEKMNIELENMTQFLRHEMSNALLGATGTIKLLEKKEPLSERGQELVSRTQKLHGVIKYLLESVKEAKNIESSFSQDEKRPVRIDLLISGLVNNYPDFFHHNEFLFESNSEALTVLATEERLNQMMQKLTSNAVDYSDSGTTITYSLRKDNNHAVIKVINQGVALPGDKDKIFDLFASFEEKNENRQNQGIGLYVVKLIAEAYDGTVSAQDRADTRGAEFTIKLPLIK